MIKYVISPTLETFRATFHVGGGEYEWKDVKGRRVTFPKWNRKIDLFVYKRDKTWLRERGWVVTEVQSGAAINYKDRTVYSTKEEAVQAACRKLAGKSQEQIDRAVAQGVAAMEEKQ